jgi:hypothetical protein
LGPIWRQAELGEFDLGAQRDFAEYAVKARIPTALPECAGRDLEACQSRRIGDPGQQGELECVERVQRVAPPFETAVAARAGSSLPSVKVPEAVRRSPAGATTGPVPLGP